MADRFVVESFDDQGIFGWRIIDTLTGEEVGRDGGEPEDQLLVRDWKWVAPLLNKLAAEGEGSTAALRDARTTLLNVTPKLEGVARIALSALTTRIDNALRGRTPEPDRDEEIREARKLLRLEP